MSVWNHPADPVSDTFAPTGHLAVEEVTSGGDWRPADSDWTLLRVAAGRGRLRQEGCEHAVARGDGIIVPRGTGCVFQPDPPGRMKFERLRVRLDWLGGVLTLPERHHLDTLFRAPGVRPMILRAGGALAAEISDAFKKSRGRHGLASRCALLELFAKLIARELEGMRVNARSVPKASERFNQALGSMAQTDLAVRSLRELARACGCSERHFSRLFREKFGGSVRATQLELRMQRAGQLLRESSDKVMTVAMESGYRHIGLFNALFKRRFGMTPSEWRRQNTTAPGEARSQRVAGGARLAPGTPTPGFGPPDNGAVPVFSVAAIVGARHSARNTIGSGSKPRA